MLEDMMITIFNDDIGINQDVIEVDDVKKLLGQIIKEIAEIDDRNGWIPIDEVFDIILKYQKGGKWWLGYIVTIVRNGIIQEFVL